MIYTSYEMVRDCRADKAEGWSYFLSQYVPVIRKLLAHYAPSHRGLEDILLSLRKPESSLFQSVEPSPERWFVAELRQKVLAELPAETPEIPLDLETVALALEPLTVVEKQVAWLDTMRYTAKETGVMMRMSAETAAQIRSRAAELIRGKVDAWRPALLSENGPALGLLAVKGAGKDCLQQKEFLDVLDGRTTWIMREGMERHITGCWHCVDHFCRMVEVVDLMRGLRPLTEVETEPYRQRLGVKIEKPSVWKRLLGRA
jgi:hypothetical protein